MESQHRTFGGRFQELLLRAPWQWSQETAGDCGFDTDERVRTAWANAVWDYFEETWATALRIYLINDAEAPQYQQDTAKDCVIAFVRARQNRVELNTYESRAAQAALDDRTDAVIEA